MTTPNASLATSGNGDMVRVWDPFIRFSHWVVATLFFVAYLTEDDVMIVHVWAGYFIGLVVFLRVLWGLVGPRHARFTDFIYRPSKVAGYLRDLMALRGKRYLGHSPAGGAMVAALLLGLAAVVASGLVLYALDYGAGPLAMLRGGSLQPYKEFFEEVHEILANLTLALAIAHVAGVLLASFAHHENLVKAMITGRKRSGD